MSQTFWTQVDFSGIPLKNIAVEGSNTAPANPVDNQLWVDTSIPDDARLMFYDGDEWVDLGAASAGATTQVYEQTTAPTQAVEGDIWIDPSQPDYVGDPGPPGAAATIAAGTTTTGAPGTNASVTNSGTTSAAVFDFTIPQGIKGDQGDQGPAGASASAYEYTYSSTSTPPPATGQLRTDGSTADTNTVLYLAYAVQDGSVVAPLLRNITINDEITLQDKTDASSAANYVVASDAVDNPAGQYVSVAVTYINSVGSVSKNNQRVLVFHSKVGAQGPKGDIGPMGVVDIRFGTTQPTQNLSVGTIWVNG